MVPPRHYGGIERVVADLADALVTRDHDVTLWAAPGSGTKAHLQSFGRQGEWTRWSNVRNTLGIGMRLRFGRSFDVIHNFGRLAYLAPVFAQRIGKIQTYMRRVNPRNMTLAAKLGARHLIFTAVSDAIRRTGQPGGGDWRVVYNCARPSLYTLTTEVNAATAPLVFLGRLERCKGAHTAIDVAKGSGRNLIIAGNVSALPEEQEYFEREIRPRIDGEQVKYVGPVDDAQKKALLGGAAALLLPIEWEEPFPVVLPEALLCGTPVLAFPRGGVPEGITHGVSGYVCNDTQAMIAAVSQLPLIDRTRCRREGEKRFSDAVITDHYEMLYREVSGR